jgi:hypothetical protein
MSLDLNKILEKYMEKFPSIKLEADGDKVTFSIDAWHAFFAVTSPSEIEADKIIGNAVETLIRSRFFVNCDPSRFPEDIRGVLYPQKFSE